MRTVIVNTAGAASLGSVVVTGQRLTRRIGEDRRGCVEVQGDAGT